MMLTILASSLLLAGRVLGQQTCDSGQHGKTQSGSNNYVIDYFSSALLFTYAIGQCTAVDLADDTNFVKYTCMQDDSDMWWATKSTYTTKTCSGTATSTMTWNSTAAEAGQKGYFKCDGMNNYARVQISIDSGCAGALDVYGGLGGCAQNPSSFDTKFYCNTTGALVQLYVNPESINATQIPMCSDNYLYCTKWNFRSSGCALSASLNGLPVYGKMVTCELSAATTTSGGSTTMGGSTTTMGGSTTTMTMTTSSAKSFSVLSAVVALFVGLFY